MQHVSALVVPSYQCIDSVSPEHICCDSRMFRPLREVNKAYVASVVNAAAKGGCMWSTPDMLQTEVRG